MFKLDLEKAEEPQIKLPTFAGSKKKQENYRKTSTSVSLTTPKPLTNQRVRRPERRVMRQAWPPEGQRHCCDYRLLSRREESVDQFLARPWNPLQTFTCRGH